MALLNNTFAKESLLLSFLIAPFFTYAQNVGIGTTIPHTSAKLEVSSTTQGILVPRMNSVQRTAISSPATGLLVFDTDNNSFWFYNGTSWSNLSLAGTAWQLTGNTGTDTSINFIGTADNRPLKFKINNQRAGLIGINGNIFWGLGSGNNSVGASNNIAIGANTLSNNFSPETIAIGAFALNNNSSGDHNTAIGSHALENNTTGILNTAFGNYSLWSKTTGSSNTAIGADVLVSNLRGTRNTAVGTNAMFYDTTGNDNTTLGFRGLFNNLNGSRNTAIGTDALLMNTTGNNNLALGYKADVSLNNLQNASAIGTLARVDCSNCMVLGSVNGVNGASSSVNVGIGTNSPARPLSFPAILGKKISLYPGASGDAGFGVFGNELRIHSDYAGADITFGYDDYTLGFSEKMRIKGNSYTGIGTSTPLARLHVTDSSVLFSAAGPVPVTQGNPPVSGEGRRMMWHPDKAAFRAGYTDGTHWDKTNIGDYSFATGYSTLASGFTSTALGNFTVASEYASTAIGYSSAASGLASAAIGLGTTAKAVGSFATGSFNDNTDIPDPFSDTPLDRIFQVGNGNGTTRSNALTVLRNGNIGVATTTPGFAFSFGQALGDKISLWSNSTNSYGFGIQSGLLQIHTDVPVADIAFGYGSSASFTERMRVQGNGKVGIGISAPNAPLAFANTTGSKICLFESSPNSQYGFAIQGAQLQVYSDNPAAKISFGYYMGGTYTEKMYLNNSTGHLFVNSVDYPSDVRLKKDIAPLQNSLQRIIQLNGYTYRWKNQQADNRLQTGVLAQEVQQLFPELVTENKEGVLAVNYSGLIPLMIESIKEQQRQIDELKKMVRKISKQ
jgi:hypothetical protein